MFETNCVYKIILDCGGLLSNLNLSLTNKEEIRWQAWHSVIIVKGHEDADLGICGVGL